MGNYTSGGIYRCNVCGDENKLRGPSFNNRGQVKLYKLEDQREVEVQETLGWCFECNKIRMVEDFSCHHLLMATESAFESWKHHEKKLNSLEVDYKRELELKEAKLNVPLLGIILKPLSKFLVKHPTADIEAEKRDLKNWKYVEHKWLNKYKDATNYYHARNSPPKCLACGGTNIKELDQDMVHPLCGGKFVLIEEPVKYPNMRINVGSSEAYYDSDGIPIGGQNPEIK